MFNSKLLLIVAGLLIVVGLTKPDLSFLNNKPSPVVLDTIVQVSKPTDSDLLEKCDKVISSLKQGPSSRKYDGQRLALLYLDLSTLIELDGDNEVVKTTEEIRQANSLAGLMLRLNIKGDYPDLAEAAKDLVVSSVGDDAVNLDSKLRSKASQAFKALAWACNEGSK